MISAVAVDDNPKMHRILKRMLKKSEHHVELVGTAATYHQALEVIGREEPTLLFLDIELNDEYTGFHVLEHFKDQEFLVILISSFESFGSMACRFEAVDYLNKPVDVKLFDEALERVREKLKPRSVSSQMGALKTAIHNIQQETLPTRFAVRAEEATYYTLIENIIHLRSDENLIRVTCDAGEHYTRTGRLVNYIKHFKPYFHFYPARKGWLVNLKKVKAILPQRTILLTNGDEFQVTAQSLREIRRRLDLL